MPTEYASSVFFAVFKWLGGWRAYHLQAQQTVWTAAAQFNLLFWREIYI